MTALIRERLYTPVLGDILESMGRYRHFLPAGIRQKSTSPAAQWTAPVGVRSSLLPSRCEVVVRALLDGYHRDTRRVLEQQWPAFGAYAQDAAVRSAIAR